MDSPRIIPFHAAAAYGVKPKALAGGASSRAGAPITPPAMTAGSAAGSAASRAAVGKLVSGKVDSAVSRGQGFDTPLAPNGSLAMYSRAADRVEVATAARLGRIVDLRA